MSGGCLSPFLFSMYVNDLEETFVLQAFKGIKNRYVKIIFIVICRRYRYIFRIRSGVTTGFR